MKNTYLFVAAAALLTASCADDSSLGSGNDLAQSKAIAFDMQTPAMLKATENGQNAATKLGNEFIVWGEKNETDGTGAGSTNLVFENYRVNYTINSANTTTSNTKDWEYVGITPYESTKVSPAITTTQTIKYWDYKADSYTFTAVSADQNDIKNGNVVITKTQTGDTKYAKGYTIELKNSDAKAGSIYVADRNVISKGNGTDRSAVNAYGGNVTLKFRNFQTKVRFGIYEVIPGYKVQITNVTFASTASTTNFGVDGKFINVAEGTKYTVTYEDGTNGTTENKATVKVDDNSTSSNCLKCGTNVFNKDLGTSSTVPTYDTDGGAYTAILPNPDNTENLKLTISYKLISLDTGEEIAIDNKTAVVPAAYCQWKANYAYTYLFKITDNEAELYPITFDAVVETDENGSKQETITTVDEPSITTFAVTGDASTGYTAVTGTDEYAADNEIYASVVKNNSVVTLSGSDIKVYSVVSSDATNFPITAASVANAIAHTGGKITATEITGATVTTNASVPIGDGTTATRSLSAVTWKATASTTYAVEYTYTDNSTTKKIYKIVIAK